MTCLPFVLCPLLGNPHRSLIRWLIILTSSSSCNTSSMRSITLFPFSLSLTLKISYIFKLSTRGIVFLISIWCPLLLIIAFNCFSLYYTKLVLIILSAGEIMLLCSRCAEKGLIYIIIASPTSRQLLSCAKCIKVNIYSSCNIHSTFNIKYTLLISLYNFLVPYLIYYRVLCLNSC